MNLILFFNKQVFLLNILEDFLIEELVIAPPAASRVITLFVQHTASFSHCFRHPGLIALSYEF
jgi:hypothetical protein